MKYFLLTFKFRFIKYLVLTLFVIFNFYKQRTYFKEKKNMNDMDIKKILYQRLTRASIEWPLPKEIKIKPIMTLKELKAFCYFMKKGNIYFEFGSGGSTNLASYYQIKTYSVESDVRWHKKLKESNITANYITIDLKSHYYGYPGKQTTINDWKKYIQAYKREYNANIILIDGRFRVACGLDIFNKINNDTIILIHDYTNRKYYHILENYYQKIDSWDTLTAFIKRINIKKIPKKIYNKYLRKPN